MSYRLPYPVNRRVNNQGQYHNPAQSVPFPQPKDMPVGCWFGGGIATPNVVALWTLTGNDYSYIWRSPIFDLRPDLRALGQESGQSYVGAGGIPRRGMNMVAVPIWGPLKTLFVQVTGLRNGANQLLDMRFEFSEAAGLKSSGNLNAVIPLTTISEYFQTQTDSAVLAFQPYGGSHPMRFWQCEIKFTRVEGAPAGKNTGIPSSYRIEAAMY